MLEKVRRGLITAAYLLLVPRLGGHCFAFYDGLSLLLLFVRICPFQCCVHFLSLNNVRQCSRLLGTASNNVMLFLGLLTQYGLVTLRDDKQIVLIFYRGIFCYDFCSIYLIDIRDHIYHLGISLDQFWLSKLVRFDRSTVVSYRLLLVLHLIIACGVVCGDLTVDCACCDAHFRWLSFLLIVPHRLVVRVLLLHLRCLLLVGGSLLLLCG